MKTYITAALLILCIGILGAADRETSLETAESPLIIDHLMSITQPGAPELIGGAALFTVSSAFQRVGIAFAHEGYGKIYWCKRLMVRQDPALLAEAAAAKIKIDPYRDSGILFHAQPVPEGLRRLEYRLIVGGLWTRDPLNPNFYTDVSGIDASFIDIPRSPPSLAPRTAEGVTVFTWQGPPGERVTVGGDFNQWDFFMYEFRETRPGFYRCSVALPPGVYRYAFFHNGERLLDPGNPRRAYTAEGRTVSEVLVPGGE